MKTFAEANEVLRAFWPENLSRPAYTLEYMIHLMDYLGNPQDKLKIIHVAGTSGKTSTAYYCAALLKAAGKNVGLCVSPHVDEVNERAQINLQPLPEADFCEDLTIFLELVKKSGLQPTYFEVMIGFAFWEFARCGMEYAVIEVGMGGLLDGTNVVNRPDKVCVITDIGMDHLKSLGPELKDIAEHKAGIIQLHNTIFCYGQGEVIMRQLRGRAKQKLADLHVLAPSAARADQAALPLFQQRNLGLACAAVDWALQQNDEPGLTDQNVARAAKTYVPARMETTKINGKTLIVDGAHNPQKMHALAESLRQKYPGQPIAAVIGFVGKREYRLNDSVKELARLLDYVVITSFKGSQDERHNSVDAQEVAELFAHHGAKAWRAVSGPQEALDILLKRPEPILLVAGSFYLLNELRPLVRKLYKR